MKRTIPSETDYSVIRFETELFLQQAPDAPPCNKLSNRSKDAKYRAAFRSSKETIVAWERRFEEKNGGRKPSAAEQTEAVRTCYRDSGVFEDRS